MQFPNVRRIRVLVLSTSVLTSAAVLTGHARASSTDAVAGGLRAIAGLDAGPRAAAALRPAVPAAKPGAVATVPDDHDFNHLRPAHSGMRIDAQNRVMVMVHLTDTADTEAARANVAKVGGRLASEQRMFPGVFTAFIPASQIVPFVRATNGVRTVRLAPQVTTHVGLVTPPSLQVLKADIAQKAGFKGQGITIGVLSDSFDLARGDTANPPLTNADQDIVNGDLPGPGNPDGYTSPVLVLDEQAGVTSGTDEGRAMLQIIHDIAPAAKLCFASAFNGEDAFAANILTLADKTQGCGADVIVDDVGYSDEGVFSDTSVAQAIDAVFNEGVVYLTSTGNGNQSAYNGVWTPVSDAKARAGLPTNNLKLAQVPTTYTAGGFHNFAAATGGVDIVKLIQPRAVPDGLFLQWDDPFFKNAMTANYNLLIFDADGNFLEKAPANGDPTVPFSGVGEGIAIDEPYQEANIPLGVDAKGNPVARILQYAVARGDTSTQGAKHFRVFDFQAQYFQLNYLQLFAPAIFGHPNAMGAIGVAAEYVRDTAAIEYFSSLGPSTTYVDNLTGLRLARPQVRNKPDLAATDGVATSFFFGPRSADGGGFPTFFGTSAAAPHAAAVAALVLQAAGGPGAMAPEQVRSILKASAGQHAIDHGTISAQLLGRDRLVTITVTGFTPEATPDGTNQFRIAYNFGPGGVALDKVTFDTSATGTNQVGTSTEQFSLGFYPGNTVNVDPAAISSNAGKTLSNTLTTMFANKAFRMGGRVNFGVDFDQSTLGNTGITPGLLDGTIVTATFSDGTRLSNRLTSRKGTGYDPYDGYGLINTVNAINLVPQAGTTRHPVASAR